MIPRNYKVQIRDDDLSLIGEIDDAQLEYKLKFNGVSTWILNVNSVSQAAQLTEGRGVVISRNGEVILSGPMTFRSDEWDEKGDYLEIAGVSDDIHVFDRLALPCNSPFTAAAYDTQTSVAGETAMKHYVTKNLTSSAWTPTGRAITGLTMETDAARGTTIRDQARFTELGLLLNRIALAAGGLGWRIAQVGTALQFQVYEPVDKSDEFAFSPGHGNLAGRKYSIESPEVTFVFSAGGGEGTARTFRTVSDATQEGRWGRRVEKIVDRRDTTDTTQLDQAGTEALLGGAEKATLVTQPTDTESVQFQRDYNLGDKVSVVAGVTLVTDIIREINATVDANGELLKPVVGTPGATDPDTVLAIYGEMAKLRQRIRNLEGR